MSPLANVYRWYQDISEDFTLPQFTLSPMSPRRGLYGNSLVRTCPGQCGVPSPLPLGEGGRVKITAAILEGKLIAKHRRGRPF